MTYKEPDYETLILLKLRAMEDFLKSFMSSLNEPFQRKQRMSIQVQAPARFEKCRIYRWNFRDGDTVVGGDLLCVVENIRIPGDAENVYSPAMGILNILVRAGEEVRGGGTIATIRVEFA